MGLMIIVPLGAGHDTAADKAVALLDPFDAYVTRITPAVQPPTLRIARSGSNVLLIWPSSFVGYSLEFSNPVGGSLPASWQVATGTPLVIGDQQAIIQPASQPTRVYRLHRP